jgi:glycosyltransferase involved in cell wall biosynthesis
VKLLAFNWKDLDHPAAGGAEVFTERILAELVARGHEVKYFVAAVDRSPEREWRDGYEIIRRGSRLGVYREARRFWKTEGRTWADIVLDEINTRPFLTPRYVTEVPILALVHQLAREIWRYEMPFPVWIAGRYHFEAHWLRTYRDIPTITDGPSSARSLESYGLRTVSPVPMGADAIRKPEVPKEPVPTVVFLGRLAAMKRPMDVVEAFASLRREHPDSKLWFVGDGPMRSRLEGLARDHIQVLGRVSDAERADRLARAHVLVATSVREGWGLNVSEAAACGTPAIGYAAPGLEDSVPASGGALVAPHPQALGDALCRFFAGELVLEPKVSTVPWSVTTDAVEARLTALLEDRAAPRR